MREQVCFPFYIFVLYAMLIMKETLIIVMKEKMCANLLYSVNYQKLIAHLLVYYE